MPHYTRHGDDEESQQPAAWHEDLGTSFKESCNVLPPKQRLCAFLISGGTGAVLLVLAVVRLRPWDLVPFAILYSLGSLCLIGATMFLVGPMRQLRQMFRRYRWVATTAYFSTIALTLFVALYGGFSKPFRFTMCLILVVLQFFAACWYSLSYIPFARKAIGKVIGKRCGRGGH